MPNRPHYIINYQKMRDNMLCLLMGPVMVWKSIRSERLLYRVPCNKLQKLVKEKVNRDNLQKRRLSICL